MTREEAVNKNLDLSFEFDRYLFEHPKFAQRIPDNALVVLLPKYDRELREYNILVAKRNQEPGQPIVMVEIDALRPQRSRLVRPRMKVPRFCIITPQAHEHAILMHSDQPSNWFFQREGKSGFGICSAKLRK